MRARIRASLSLGLLVFAAARAEAGAWIAPEGGQVIQTEVLSAPDDAPVLESQLYLEAPVAERVSLVARPWLENGETVGEEGWRAEVEGGVKAAVLRTPNAALAVQASAVWRSDPDFGCGEGAGEVRALGGVSFAEGRGFVNTETAARLHDGGCPAGRVDLTLGYRPAPRWLGMAETFVFAPEGREAAVKAQFSLVRFSERGTGVQLGLRLRLDGEDAEPALVLAFWGRPRD